MSCAPNTAVMILGVLKTSIPAIMMNKDKNDNKDND